MARFLQQFETGRGDYTRELESWLVEDPVESLVEKIRQSRENGQDKKA